MAGEVYLALKKSHVHSLLEEERNPMKLETSLRLLRTEAIITAAVIAMPIMNPFFMSIGMDQGQIGLSQALFTVALLLCNVPTGWLADRFSRKLSNAFGDIVAALGFLLYALAQNFAHVVGAEILIGIGLAFSNGADVGLLRACCERSTGGWSTRLRIAMLRSQPSQSASR